MQTFLPYADYAKSAACLDYRRLGKQRVENLQIMKALMTGVGWVNHPATLMWRRYEWSLLLYQEAICREWTDVRGYKDTCLLKTQRIYYEHCEWTEQHLTPYWLGDPKLHLAYQAKLIRKDPWHYLRYFPETPYDLPFEYPKPAEPYTNLRIDLKQWAEGWMD